MKSRDITRTYGSWYIHYIVAGGLQTLYVRHRKRTWTINRWCRRKARWSFDSSGKIKLAPAPNSQSAADLPTPMASAPSQATPAGGVVVS